MQTVLSQKWAGLSFYSGALLAHAFFSVERGFLIGPERPETRAIPNSKFDMPFYNAMLLYMLHVGDSFSETLAAPRKCLHVEEIPPQCVLVGEQPPVQTVAHGELEAE